MWNSKLLLIIVTLLLSLPAWANKEGNEEGKIADIEKMISEFPAALREVPTLSSKELKKKKTEYIVIDVRPEAEREVSVIPGALTIKEYKAKKDAKTPAVTYCTIGYRSALEAKKLRKLGFPVLNLKGGILLWTHAGGELVDPKGKLTTKAHVYGPTWDLLPNSFTPVW